MGQGRRMGKKQGAPEPLSAEHFAKLKRKAGLPVDDTEGDAPAKRRRRSKKPEPEKAIGRPKAQPRQPSAAKATQNGTGTKTKKAQKATAAATAPDSDVDVDVDGEMAAADDDEEFSGLDEDEFDGAKLGDDFLGSDDDDSVYDSDQEMTGGKKEQFVFSDDEDDSDEDREEKLTQANIVGLSQKLDKQMEEDEEAAEAELRESALQTNIDGDKPDVLVDGDEEDDELAAKSKSLLAPDLQLLRQRITDTIRILEDFANLGAGRSRAEYTAQVLKDICAYYNYNEFLAEKLYNLFPPREAFAFFEANESPRPVVIRTNTLRTHRRDLAQALINRGVTLEPVGKWSKVGLQVFESTVPLGATPEYLAGHYILQAASSFLPVMALSPQPNERVLDMAAAPGGKTTHCAALMKNTGVIMANDPNKARAKGLIGNVYRLGAQNVIVCSYDAREFPRVMGGFDRVLLDAPCSGTGVIAKDPSVKTNKNEKDFMVLPHTQKQLLLSAIDSVNHHSSTGGYLVYSTCSVTVEENEEVVAYALSRRPNVRLVETGLPFGKEGFTSYMGKKFDASLKLTRRYYPHTYNVDGFFVAKFKKFGPTPANAVLAPEMKRQAGSSKKDAGEAEYVDRTPIAEEGEGQDDEFGGFDEGEDKEYIERAKKNAMRRRGLDPKALNKKASKEGLNGGEKKAEDGKAAAKEAAKEDGKQGGREDQPTKALAKKASKQGLNGAKGKTEEVRTEVLKKKASKDGLKRGKK
ncbi:NOL1/NOP2/sun family putative RNA met [Coniochaeta hoffmannii]|uniref:Nucleolar protein 2 n=1 Tax=Coniochaeta hoffmannii TaxID=91930 RepID=A0AA38VHA9_9PEZI|nr:NOL1/NOP2/sun family putative RNA met [Coniochaeta hoffmannii]